MRGKYPLKMYIILLRFIMLWFWYEYLVNWSDLFNYIHQRSYFLNVSEATHKDTNNIDLYQAPTQTENVHAVWHVLGCTVSSK